MKRMALLIPCLLCLSRPLLACDTKPNIVFTSDNGPTDWPHYYRLGVTPPGFTGPLFGRKWSLYEGGIRMPFIARWKGKIPAGATNDATTMAAIDILPSLAKLTGSALPKGRKFDGEDMLEALLGKPIERTTPLFWEYGVHGSIKPGKAEHVSPQLAMRHGQWKLLCNPDGSALKLFNLSSDIGEQSNLAASQQKIVGRMQAQLLAWWKAMDAHYNKVAYTANVAASNEDTLRQTNNHIVWTLEAKHVAAWLGLTDKQTTKLVTEFIKARESYTESVTARFEELAADIPKDQYLKRGRIYTRAATEVGESARNKFRQAVEGFLDKEQAKKAAERLGTFHDKWDLMVEVTADLKLTQQQQTKALEFINTYVVDHTEIKLTSGNRNNSGLKLMNKLEKDLETVLSEGQMPRWFNGVVRTDKDNERSINDPRVQHRTYQFKEAGGIDIPYALFVPSTYNEENKYPLMVSLHGLGRTYDWLMGYEGILDFAERDGYIVVAPLGYIRGGWYGSVENGRTGELSEKDVMNVYEIVRREFNIDANRIYLWGHSMGGAGTYRLAEKHPDIWAALGVAAPAPFRSVDVLEKFKHIPIIVLQGDQDWLVNATRRWVAKMKEIGTEHIYIEDSGGDHSEFISKNPENLSGIFSFFNSKKKTEPKE